MSYLINLLSILSTSLLGLFTARRGLFMLTALKPTPPRPLPTTFPQVLLLVPIRNEAEILPECFHALNQLNYPALTVILINDGSTDNSQQIINAWVARTTHWHSFTLPNNVGKAQALNLALAQFPQGEFIAIYDADERPTPAALSYLVAACIPPQVGAVSGQRRVANPLASPIASYTTFETLVHQFITLRAKDTLNLAPALLGANCLYRRAALAQCGGFKPQALLEDTDITLKLARLGWHTRYEPQALSYHEAPTRLAGYWQQHSRWARGFQDVAQEQTRSLWQEPQLSWPLRLELWLFSLGYVDRLALVLAGVSLWLGRKPYVAYMLGLTLLLPFLQTLVALKLAHAPRALWGRVIGLPLFFLLDLSMAIWGVGQSLGHTAPLWEERRAR